MVPPTITAQILPDLNDVYAALNNVQKSLRNKADIQDFSNLRQQIEPRLTDLSNKLTAAENMEAKIVKTKAAVDRPVPAETQRQGISTPQPITTGRGLAAGFKSRPASRDQFANYPEPEPEYMAPHAQYQSHPDPYAVHMHGPPGPPATDPHMQQAVDELAGLLADKPDWQGVAELVTERSAVTTHEELGWYEDRFQGVTNSIKSYVTGLAGVMQTETQSLRSHKADKSDLRRLERLVALALGMPSGGAPKDASRPPSVSDAPPPPTYTEGFGGVKVNLGGGGYAWKQVRKTPCRPRRRANSSL
jgi:hypothetical protein